MADTTNNGTTPDRLPAVFRVGYIVLVLVFVILIAYTVGANNQTRRQMNRDHEEMQRKAREYREETEEILKRPKEMERR